MKDRVPKYPGRVYVTPENEGAPYYATVERADEPVEVGTPLNKATLLSDDVANLISLSGDQATVSEALKAVFNLANPYASTSRYGRTKLTSALSNSESLAVTPKAVNAINDKIEKIPSRELLFSESYTYEDNIIRIELDLSSIDLSKYMSISIHIESSSTPSSLSSYVSFSGISNSSDGVALVLDTDSDLTMARYEYNDDIPICNDDWTSASLSGARIMDINIPIRSSDPTSMPTGLISRIVMSGYSNIVIGNINDSWDGQKITVYTDRLGKGSTYVYGEKI